MTNKRNIIGLILLVLIFCAIVINLYSSFARIKQAFRENRRVSDAYSAGRRAMLSNFAACDRVVSFLSEKNPVELAAAKTMLNARDRDLESLLKITVLPEVRKHLETITGLLQKQQEHRKNTIEMLQAGRPLDGVLDGWGKREAVNRMIESEFREIIRIEELMQDKSQALLLAELKIIVIQFGLLTLLLCLQGIIFYELHDKRQRKKITDERNLMLQALEQSPVSVVVTDVKGDIQYVNSFFCRLTGYTWEETMGKNPRILKSGEQPTAFYKEMWDTLNAGQEWCGEFHNKKKDGTLYWEKATISPVMNKSNQIEHFVAVKEDVTQQKIIQEELEKAMRAKMDFASMVSHELRTPLSVIKEAVSIVTEAEVGPLNKDQMHLLTMTQNNVDRLARLINNVLDYQKLESAMATFQFVKNDLNALLEEVKTSFELVTRQKDLGFVLELEPNLPELVFDKDKITQVIINLLNNAVKFTEKGSITLKSERGENFVRVSIRDTGIGIKPEDIPKLFQSFTQVGDNRKTGGTGLGLSISKKIVEMHRGKVEVSSVFGEGTTFSFVLPIVERRGAHA